MLKNGNYDIQQSFFKHFSNEIDSELFFERMNKILDHEINILEQQEIPTEQKPNVVYREDIDKVEICLSVMQ